jgi:hypothetical protein
MAPAGQGGTPSAELLAAITRSFGSLDGLRAAFNQAAATLITATTGDDGVERFSLTPEAAVVLAAPDHPAYGMGMFHRLPQTMRAVEEMPTSFRTGLGHDYDSHGPQGAVGIERSFEPWNRAFLVPVVLPALDGVVDRLRVGADVADVGCGAGGAVLLMAREFPASRFTGYDISHYALGRAAQRRRLRRRRVSGGDHGRSRRRGSVRTHPSVR